MSAESEACDRRRVRVFTEQHIALRERALAKVPESDHLGALLDRAVAENA